MGRQFSNRQLYEVRNHIPIRHVIETLLAIPSETLEGVLRFRCPLCEGRHTAVKPETNLARCFACKRNFNTIDLCMLVKHMNFVDSVKLLLDHQRKVPPAECKPTCAKNVLVLEPQKTPSKKPVSLHEILAGLMANSLDENFKTKKEKMPSLSPTPNDIAELERILHNLSQILQRLKTATF